MKKYYKITVLLLLLQIVQPVDGQTKKYKDKLTDLYELNVEDVLNPKEKMSLMLEYWNLVFGSI